MTTTKTAPEILQPPALKIDAHMLLHYRTQVSPQGRLERRLAWNLIKHLERAGWVPHELYDGDDFTKVTSAEGAMELLFDLDEASLRFCRLENRAKKNPREHGVLLVMGNGIDLIADWNYSRGDPDGFDACMNSFDAEAFA